MTVKELREALADFPQDCEVFARAEPCYEEPVEDRIVHIRLRPVMGRADYRTKSGKKSWRLAPTGEIVVILGA